MNPRDTNRSRGICSQHRRTKKRVWVGFLAAASVLCVALWLLNGGREGEKDVSSSRRDDSGTLVSLNTGSQRKDMLHQQEQAFLAAMKTKGADYLAAFHRWASHADHSSPEYAKYVQWVFDKLSDDPAAAFAFADSLDELRNLYRHQAVVLAAGKDTSLCLELLGRMGLGEVRSHALLRAADQIPPKEAFRFLSRLDPEDIGIALESSALSKALLSGGASNEVISIILRSPLIESEKAKLLTSLLSQATTQQALDALGFVLSEAGCSDDLKCTAFRRVADLSPDQSLHLLEAFLSAPDAHDTPLLAGLIRSGLAAVGRSDPSAGLAWLGRLPACLETEGVLLDYLANAPLDHLAAGAKQEFASTAEKMLRTSGIPDDQMASRVQMLKARLSASASPSGPDTGTSERGRAIRQIVAEGQDNPDRGYATLKRYLASLPSQEDRRAVVGEWFSRIAIDAPKSALEIASRQPELQIDEQAFHVLVSQMQNQTDNRRIIESAFRFPGNANKDNFIRAATRSWLEFDSEAASQWIKSQTKSSERDLAILSMAGWLAESGHQFEAQPWVSEIGDPDVRKRASELLAAPRR